MKKLQKVTASYVRCTRSIGNGPFGSRTSYWWNLTLECGHEVERRVQYKPSGRHAGGIHGNRHPKDKLPAPKRARCETCTNPLTSITPTP